MTEDPQESPPSIADEAANLVYGDRREAYGPPHRDFRRIATMATGLLSDKLIQNHGILFPEDIALIMICVKMSREVHHPKRDNRVDMIGYALCLDEIQPKD